MGNEYNPFAAGRSRFIQQLTMFPGAAHDDMTDMMGRASIELQARTSGIVAFWAAETGRGGISDNMVL